MNIQKDCDREMTRISEPIDLENDRFANLLNRDKAGIESRKALLARRLREPESGRVRLLEPEHDLEEKQRGISLYVMAPLVSAGLCLTFIFGFAGASMFSKSVKPGLVMASVQQPPLISKKPTAAGVQSPLVFATTPVVPEPDFSVDALLKAGHRLEKTGQIEAARQEFKKAFDLGSGAGALALARSYDPRFVKAGGQNKLKARQWYEKWYLASVERGEISAKSRLDRLIGGLKLRTSVN